MPELISPADILTPQELAARLKVKPGWVYEKLRPRQPNPIARNQKWVAS